MNGPSDLRVLVAKSDEEQRPAASEQHQPDPEALPAVEIALALQLPAMKRERRAPAAFRHRTRLLLVELTARNQFKRKHADRHARQQDACPSDAAPDGRDPPH